MDPTTHRFQPMLDMDDDWFIVDTQNGKRTSEVFPRDTSLLFCWNLEDQPSRVDGSTRAGWPPSAMGFD